MMRRLRSSESGQALLLALGFVTFMGILGAAILNHVGVGLRMTTKFDDTRKFAYTANAGFEVAVSRMKSAVPCTSGITNINNSIDSAAPNGVNIWIVSRCVTPTPLNVDRDVVLTACRVDPSPSPTCASDKTVGTVEVYYQDIPTAGYRTIIKNWSVAK